MQPIPKPKVTSSVMLWTLAGSFENRLETAARAGMQSVELVGEHRNWTPERIREVRRILRSYRMPVDLLSAAPEWKTKPISLLDPAQQSNLLAEVQTNLTLAHELEVPGALLMTGDAIAGRTRQQQWTTLVDGCRRAGDLAAKERITLLVEPLNTRIDHPGYFLDNCVDGLKLIREVDHPQVKLLFDIYHEQVQSGNVTASLEAAAPVVKVFHVADNPGRSDPGTGEIRYEHLYRVIKKLGFEGHVAMEYRPAGDPVRSLIRAVEAMRDAMA